MYSESAAPLLCPILSKEGYPRQPAALRPTLPTFHRPPKDAAQPLEPSKGARLGQHGRFEASPTRGLGPSRRSLRHVANEGGELREALYICRAGRAEGEAKELETAGAEKLELVGLTAELSDGRHRSYSPAGSSDGSSGSSCTHGRTCCPYSRDAPASGRRHSSSSLPPPREGQGKGARRGNAS